MSNKLIDSIQVYNYVQNRYSHYDKEFNKGIYTGEKYTKQVFQDAAKHFNCSLKNIEKLYSEFSYTDIDKALNLINKVKNNELIFEDLSGEFVKINVDNYLKNDKQYTKVFISFIKENKDTIFTAVKTSTNDLYELQDGNGWLFSAKDLIRIEVKINE